MLTRESRGFGILAVISVACADAPNDPEVRLGAGDLQFIRSAADCMPSAPCPLNILADYDLANPYYNWSINGDQLEPVALASGSNGNPSETRIDLIPLDETPNIQMRYRSTAPFTQQDEILLFARDPEELFRTLTEDFSTLVQTPLPSNFTKWLDDLDPRVLPQAATMVYPPAAFFTPATFSTVSLPTSAFFGPLTPGGVASLPNGSGSVKAARVVQHGRCSTEVPFCTPAAV